MEKIKCIGCGSFLQSTDAKQLGYVDPQVLTSGREAILCRRCFRLKHYNELPEVTLSSDEFRTILSQIADEDALIVNVVDLFDFSGSLIPGLSRFVGQNDILLVGNKRDLLPKPVKPIKIKNWMRRLIKEYGIQAKDVVLTSAEKGHGIEEVMEAIETYRNNRNVYVVGCTNVGKSTLINAIIKRYTEERDDLITVSKFPGTTIDFIEIPLDEKHYLIDTPGIINEDQYTHVLDQKTILKILPKKEVKPKVYQLNPGQTLFFGGLSRFDFVRGDRGSFVCYFNNELYIHRTKLSQADELFTQHIGELLAPPSKEEYERLGTYTIRSFTLPNEKVDLVISGLGFITVHNPGAMVRIHSPKQVGIWMRPSLF